MKRTLLAVGIAVLLSLMLVPHGGTSDNHRRYTDSMGITHRGYYSYRTPFWESSGYPVLVTELIAQTIFFAVAAAIIANIPWTKRFRLLESLFWVVVAVGLITGLGLAVSTPAFKGAGLAGMLLILLVVGALISWYVRQHRRP